MYNYYFQAMKVNTLIILLGLTFLWACETSNQSEESSKESAETITEESKAETKPYSEYAPSSVDDALAEKINDYLKNDYLKRDLQLMSENDRKFQFHKIDLNKDGEKEIFVQFPSSYFCGSGGCTFLLLNNDLKEITTFTVTNPPIFVEDLMANGWKVLLVKDQGVFKELRFEDGSYPTNPSILDRAPYDAPSGHAQVLFGKDNQTAKTYRF